MKIYLAGNNAMEKGHRQKLYSRFLKGRLFSYYEICPPRWACKQWRWVSENLLGR